VKIGIDDLHIYRKEVLWLLIKKRKSLILQVFVFILKSLKYLLAPIIALLGAVALSLYLDGYELTQSHFKFTNMIEIIQTGEHTMMLFLALLAVIGIIYLALSFTLTGKSDYYQARKVEITDKIKTPASMGQGQHGTAKWLTERQIKRTFSTCVLDIKKDKTIKELFFKGNKSKNAVKKASKDKG